MGIYTVKLLILLLGKVFTVAIYPNGRLTNWTEAASNDGSKVLRQFKAREPILYGLGYFRHDYTLTMPPKRSLMESTRSCRIFAVKGCSMW